MARTPLGELIYKRRSELGLSAASLNDSAGLPAGQVNRWETTTGRRWKGSSPIPADRREKLAEALQLPISEVLAAEEATRGLWQHGGTTRPVGDLTQWQVRVLALMGEMPTRVATSRDDACRNDRGLVRDRYDRLTHSGPVEQRRGDRSRGIGMKVQSVEAQSERFRLADGILYVAGWTMTRTTFAHLQAALEVICGAECSEDGERPVACPVACRRS